MKACSGRSIFRVTQTADISNLINSKNRHILRFVKIIHLTSQYNCGIMVLWESMGAPCVTHPHTHHRDRVRVSSAFNPGPLWGPFDSRSFFQ